MLFHSSLYLMKKVQVHFRFSEQNDTKYFNRQQLVINIYLMGYLNKIQVVVNTAPPTWCLSMASLERIRKICNSCFIIASIYCLCMTLYVTHEQLVSFLDQCSRALANNSSINWQLWKKFHFTDKTTNLYTCIKVDINADRLNVCVLHLLFLEYF